MTRDEVCYFCETINNNQDGVKLCVCRGRELNYEIHCDMSPGLGRRGQRNEFTMGCMARAFGSIANVTFASVPINICANTWPEVRASDKFEGFL